MKLARILFPVSLGAALATACGGIATTSSPFAARDAGLSTPLPEQDASPAASSNGPPGAAGFDAGTPGFNVSCQGSQSCPPAQICCFSFSGIGGINVACATSCPPGAYQICATSAECTTRGDVCTSSPLGFGGYCAASGGGTRGQPDGGAAADGGAPDATVPPDATVAYDAGDAAIVDATVFDASVVDATSPDATSPDATGSQATGSDATSSDATGDDTTGDEATDGGFADDGSSAIDAGDP